MVLFQLLIHLLHVVGDHRVDLLVAGVQGVDELFLADVGGKLVLLVFVGDHGHQFLDPDFEVVVGFALGNFQESMCHFFLGIGVLELDLLADEVVVAD